MIPEPKFPAKPDEFVGRKPQLEAFRRALKQGAAAGRTPSFAVLGALGIGKSSLLLKCSAVCAEPQFNMLPVPFSVSKELGDYRRFAELLVDAFGECIARTQSIQANVRREVQNWKLKRVNVGPLSFQRETSQLFLTSGTAILRHAVQDAWRRFIQPAQLNGVVFFLDDLHHLCTPSQDAIALALRDQFQSFGTENINCSVCFSAPANYFSNIRSLAEPAVRFYDKAYLDPFCLAETSEYVEAIFRMAANRSEFAQWLQSKAHGHPYFMAFICRQLAELSPEGHKLDAGEHWPEIFHRLEKEKFSTDLAQVTKRELQLLCSLARCGGEEISRQQFREYERIYGECCIRFWPNSASRKCGLHAFRRFRNTYLRNYTSTPPGVYRFWMGHASADGDTFAGAGESMSDRYDKAEHERSLRNDWAERAGLGFELPSKIRVIGPNGPKLNSETPKEMAVNA